VGGSGDSDDVAPLFRSNGRIDGGLASLEERFQSSLDGDGAECASREGSDEFEAVFGPRWEAIEAWEVDGDPIQHLTPVEVEIETVETPKRAKAKKAKKAKTPKKVKEAKPSEPPAKKKSTRSRGATKRPTRKATAASSGIGRSTRGSGRN
jgi:hypothetical protein